jgi:hypothetical protein
MFSLFCRSVKHDVINTVESVHAYWSRERDRPKFGMASERFSKVSTHCQILWKWVVVMRFFLSCPIIAHTYSSLSSSSHQEFFVWHGGVLQNTELVCIEEWRVQACGISSKQCYHLPGIASSVDRFFITCDLKQNVMGMDRIKNRELGERGTLIQREQGDLISLILFVQNKEDRLKTNLYSHEHYWCSTRTVTALL